RSLTNFVAQNFAELQRPRGGGSSFRGTPRGLGVGAVAIGRALAEDWGGSQTTTRSAVSAASARSIASVSSPSQTQLREAESRGLRHEEELDAEGIAEGEETGSHSEEEDQNVEELHADQLLQALAAVDEAAQDELFPPGADELPSNSDNNNNDDDDGSRRATPKGDFCLDFDDRGEEDPKVGWSADKLHVKVDPIWRDIDAEDTEDGTLDSALDVGDVDAEKARGALRPVKGMRSVQRLWCALVSLSLLELVLVAGGTAADHLYSPCREKLASCGHLHAGDCQGTSCRNCAPAWASVWPASGLLFLAVPLRCVLRGSPHVPDPDDPKDSRCPRSLPVLLVMSLAVLGAGAAALAEFSSAGLHYASRCPMQRAASRCTADICPSPPCRRESEFSPCVCGLLGEAELARALWLKGFPACQPYEWYSSQMGALEELVLRYETFACVAGPLTCTATAVGGALLLVQLACCPLLLVGQWGGYEAILVLIGSIEDLDAAFLGAPGSASSRRLAALSTESPSGLPLPQQIPPPASADTPAVRGKPGSLIIEAPEQGHLVYGRSRGVPGGKRGEVTGEGLRPRSPCVREE
ncbi:unnamed protein product, partial [Polarella glacialis]